VSTRGSLRLQFGTPADDEEYDCSKAVKNPLADIFDAALLDLKTEQPTWPMWTAPGTTGKGTGPLAYPDPAAPEEEESRLTLIVSSRLDGARGSTDRSDSDPRPKSELTVEFKPRCQEFLGRICWMVSPIEYPEWVVNAVEYEYEAEELQYEGPLPVLYIDIDAEGQAVIFDDPGLKISWPKGNLNQYLSRSRGEYGLSVRWHPPLAEGKQLPPLWCVGPLFGGDVSLPSTPSSGFFGGLPDDGDKILFFGVRVPLEFLLSADGTEAAMGEESIFIDEEKAFQPRTRGGGVFLHTADPETGKTEFSTSFAVTAEALTEGLKEYDLTALPAEFEIVLKQYPAYGRCEFSGHGMCVIDGEEEPQTLRHAVHFNRDQPWNVYHSAPIINAPVAKIMRTRLVLMVGGNNYLTDDHDIYLNGVFIGSRKNDRDEDMTGTMIFLNGGDPNHYTDEEKREFWNDTCDFWYYSTGHVVYYETFTTPIGPVIGENVLEFKSTAQRYYTVSEPNDTWMPSDATWEIIDLIHGKAKAPGIDKYNNGYYDYFSRGGEEGDPGDTFTFTFNYDPTEYFNCYLF